MKEFLLQFHFIIVWNSLLCYFSFPSSLTFTIRNYATQVKCEIFYARTEQKNIKCFVFFERNRLQLSNREVFGCLLISNAISYHWRMPRNWRRCWKKWKSLFADTIFSSFQHVNPNDIPMMMKSTWVFHFRWRASNRKIRNIEYINFMKKIEMKSNLFCPVEFISDFRVPTGSRKKAHKRCKQIALCSVIK